MPQLSFSSVIHVILFKNKAIIILLNDRNVKNVSQRGAYKPGETYYAPTISIIIISIFYFVNDRKTRFTDISQ